MQTGIRNAKYALNVSVAHRHLKKGRKGVVDCMKKRMGQRRAVASLYAIVRGLLVGPHKRAFVDRRQSPDEDHQNCDSHEKPDDGQPKLLPSDPNIPPEVPQFTYSGVQVVLKTHKTNNSQ